MYCLGVFSRYLWKKEIISVPVRDCLAILHAPPPPPRRTHTSTLYYSIGGARKKVSRGKKMKMKIAHVEQFLCAASAPTIYSTGG